MKKGKTKNKRSSYLTITVIPIISTIILYSLYSSTDSKAERLMLLFIFVLTIIPFTFQLLFMVLNTMISGTVKNNVSKHKNSSKSDQLIKPLNKNSNIAIPKEYKSKENNNENYLELRESIRNYSKGGYLKRNGVLIFKNELDYRLGNNRYNYSGFDFENDMHEIYIKIKSSKLTDDDYLYLKGVLEDLAG